MPEPVRSMIVVTPDLVKAGVKAGAIAKVLGERLGVRGGGKDGSAQVGGQLALPLDQAVVETWGVLAAALGGDGG